jgi:predicted nucleic acid-binding Zn ribbon protein
MHTRTEKAETRMTFWWILGLLAVWFVLQIWVLPKLGVRT